MPVLDTVRYSVATASTRRLRVGGLALALSLVTILASASPTFAWGTTAFSPSDEQLLVSLTNHDRASAGLPALTNDSYLHKEAEWRAKDMGDRDYFSHTIPPGNKMVFSDMMADHYCFKVAGENIGLSTFGDGDATSHIETAFMGSPSHRANILGTWQRIGVGAYKAADGRKLYTVLFSVPCASKKAPTKPAPKTNSNAQPTQKPAAAPTASSIATPTTGPTATPTAFPTATPTAIPTAVPMPTTPATTPGSIAAALPSSSPVAGPVAPRLNTADSPVSLRVKEKAASPGPLDALFQLLFGGLTG